jgi:hypothetical protein
MLDIAYPYLTMTILEIVRICLLILSIINFCLIVFGNLYQKHGEEHKIRKIAYFLGFIQLFFFPIGTYAGVLLLRDLNYDKIKKH